MTIDPSDTMNCPHCGGEIKTAARVCRHCKRSIESVVVSAVGTPSLPPVVPILRDLGSFVASRGLVRQGQFDGLLHQSPAVDAAVFLGHLASAGYITVPQVEVLREGFRQQQESRATALLRTACDRGLVTPAHADQALAGYRAVIFQQTMGEHLVAAGLLTAAQASELQGTPAAKMAAGFKAWWGRITKTERWIVLGVVALPVLCMLLGGIAFVVDAIRGHADIEEGGTMNGSGHGTATFTNRGTRTGSLCGHVVLRCSGGSRSSTSFCSGSVGPHETTRVGFGVGGMDRIVEGNDWRDECTTDFIHESSGD